MLPKNIVQFIGQLTKQDTMPLAIQVLVDEYLDLQIKYWSLIDKQFSFSKGMTFEEYEATQYEEWDGDDGNKREAYFKWDTAVSMVIYYKEVKQQWLSKNLSTSF